MTKKAFVLGSHTKNSLSPHIFNYWFKQNKIDGEYFFKEIKPQLFKKEINQILIQKNICGFNITIPFKELIGENLDELDVFSEEIGAVNCISRVNNRWVGRNTDWIGFLSSIRPVIKKISKKKATVIGYGGAAKSIVYALKKEKFKEIRIYNRTPEKIKQISTEDTIKIISLNEIEKAISETDIIVNTIPTNILNDLNLNKSKKKIFACDIVYNPKETGFLSHFKEEKRIYGIEMLVYQAAPCFEEWFGVKPLIDKNLFNFLDQIKKQ